MTGKLGHRTQGVVSEYWLNFAEEIERAQGESGKLESISDWTSKLPDAVARIAGLIELAETGRNAEYVSEDAVMRGVALARVLIPHAQEAFGLLGADVAESDATAILRWIRAEGCASFKRSNGGAFPIRGAIDQGRFWRSGRDHPASGF